MLINRLVVASVGFDERFLVRLIVTSKLGVNSNDLLLLIMPIGEEDKRSSYVIDYVRHFIRNYKLRIDVKCLTVDISNFWKATGEIRREIEGLVYEYSPQDMIILLSGGMRVLILEVLIGCLATGITGRVLSYREDLKGSITFPLNILSIKRPSIDCIKVLKILNKIGGKGNLKDISSHLLLSKSSTQRRVKELEENGYVKIIRKGKASKIVLTEKAFLWL